MLAPATYREIVAREIDAIARVGEGDLGAPVEHCPGFDVGKLLEHTGGFCRIVASRVNGGAEWEPSTGSWQTAPAEEVASDPLGWHRRWGAELVSSLAAGDPSERIVTWAGHRTRYFWFRRAAQELTVHRWDAEHAVTATRPIDTAVALDGIDEFLGEFGSRVAPLLGGDGETYQLIVDESGIAFTVHAQPSALVSNSDKEPDVILSGAASALLLFLWGRAAPNQLTVTGDVALANRWHERVRL